jgi:uncharacterized protein with beta-barrel porin domain
MPANLTINYGATLEVNGEVIVAPSNALWNTGTNGEVKLSNNAIDFTKGTITAGSTLQGTKLANITAAITARIHAGATLRIPSTPFTTNTVPFVLDGILNINAKETPAGKPEVPAGVLDVLGKIKGSGTINNSGTNNINGRSNITDVTIIE